MNLDTVPGSSIPARAGNSNAALLSGGLLLSAIVVNIVGSRVMESFPYENDTGVGVISIGSAFLIAAPWPSIVVENIGWWLIWPLLWWSTIAVGCLACWGFDAIAGRASKTAAPVAAKPEYMQQTPGALPAGPVVGTNAMAIAALVSSLVFSPLGIVFGHISLSQIKRTGEDGRGLAIAGVAIGYLGVALFLLSLVVFGVFFMAGLGSATY